MKDSQICGEPEAYDFCHLPLMWSGEGIDELGELAAGSEGNGIQAKRKQMSPKHRTPACPAYGEGQA